MVTHVYPLVTYHTPCWVICAHLTKKNVYAAGVCSSFAARSCAHKDILPNSACTKAHREDKFPPHSPRSRGVWIVIFAFNVNVNGSSINFHFSSRRKIGHMGPHKVWNISLICKPCKVRPNGVMVSSPLSNSLHRGSNSALNSLILLSKHTCPTLTSLKNKFCEGHLIAKAVCVFCVLWSLVFVQCF